MIRDSLALGVEPSGGHLAFPQVGPSDGEPAEASTPHSLPRRILSLLSEGGIASTADLARRLDVSQGLVGIMADDLTRRGYLARISGCHGGCGGCHAASACAESPQGAASPVGAAPAALLILTPKGRQAAAQPCNL